MHKIPTARRASLVLSARASFGWRATQFGNRCYRVLSDCARKFFLPLKNRGKKTFAFVFPRAQRARPVTPRGVVTR